MWKMLKTWWKYLAMLGRVRQRELADPKVQLEQAIEEAQQQHRRLVDQAASVIANQKQAETRLNRALEDYEKTKALARQALLLADQETRSGDGSKAARFTEAAEVSATKLSTLEREIRDLEKGLLDATSAAARAKEAVAQNSSMLQARLVERERLLSDLDRARMQEQLNKALDQMTSTIGEDVPTFEEVRKKIDQQLARAEAKGELTGNRIDAHLFEVEQAQMKAEAQTRLSQLRTELGLGAPPEPERRGTQAPGR